MYTSPYDSSKPATWKETTRKLVSEFPLSKDYLVETILECWKKILDIELEPNLSIRSIKPQPQMMGFFLHALIAHHIAADFPQEWRPERDASDKDVVNMKNEHYSLEIKTSSNAKHIYGNRSYAQVGDSSKKSKSGYYLAVNFEKFEGSRDPEITLIRLGWLDHEDWAGQASATGQQASLSAYTESNKLLTLYTKEGGLLF